MSKHIPSVLVAFLMIAFCSGCESIMSKMPHDMQPHRLWRLNRQADPNRNVYFSVPDPIPTNLADQTEPEQPSTSEANLTLAP